MLVVVMGHGVLLRRLENVINWKRCSNENTPHPGRLNLATFGKQQKSTHYHRNDRVI